MDSNEYFQKRLNNQISWYDKKSTIQKRFYYIAKTIVIVCTASIPVISIIFRSHIVSNIISGMLALIATISDGILSLTNWHEKWIMYRSNAEALKHEKYSYLTSSGFYANLSEQDKFLNLVNRTENIISNENTNWASLGKKTGNTKR